MRQLGRTFLVVWFGQVVSVAGSTITSFGLAFWVFAETGSTTRLAMIVLASRLPALLVSPFAGALIDRWDRRRAMILADTGAALGTAVIAGLLLTNTLEIWHLYVILGVSSAFGSFQQPAYQAAITLQVPREQHTRAAGMVQLAGSIGLMGGPVIAAAMLTAWGLTTLFVVDLATFGFAVATLTVVRFREPERTGAVAAVRPAALLRESALGWQFITERRGLLVLLVTFAVVNMAFAFNSVLMIPLLLGFTSETAAGAMISISAAGLTLGSVVMTLWGGPRRRIPGLLMALGVMSLGLASAGLRPVLLLTGAALTIVHASVPVAAAISQAIWQSKVPPDLQGRVFALRRMVAIAATPLAIVAAGPLADRVFEPLLMADGALAPALGGLLGTGSGRGIALIYLIVGMLALLATGRAAAHPRVMHLEEELPDASLEAGAGSSGGAAT